jgi:hypothetical protein
VTRRDRIGRLPLGGQLSIPLAGSVTSGRRLRPVQAFGGSSLAIALGVSLGLARRLLVAAGP